MVTDATRSYAVLQTTMGSGSVILIGEPLRRSVTDQRTNEPHKHNVTPTPHASFHPDSPVFCLFFFLSPLGLPFSHSHLCLAVGDEVGLRGQEVLAVAVAPAAVQLVGLQHGALRPLVAVRLPPSHRLRPVPALQPHPHRVPGSDRVGAVRQRAAHGGRAGDHAGLGRPGHAQGGAAGQRPRHVCQGGGPESWRLATVAVGVGVGRVGAVGAVGDVGHVAVAAFRFVAVGLESPATVSAAACRYVAFCGEGGDGRDAGHLCDVGGHRLWSQWTQRGHGGHGGHWGHGRHGCHGRHGHHGRHWGHGRHRGHGRHLRDGGVHGVGRHRVGSHRVVGHGRGHRRHVAHGGSGVAHWLERKSTLCRQLHHQTALVEFAVVFGSWCKEKRRRMLKNKSKTAKQVKLSVHTA